MTKTDIFKSYSLKTGSVDVWGGSFTIRELSAGAMEKMRKVDGSELQMASIAIIAGVLNDEGKPMFVDGDMAKLMEMSATDLVKVSAAIIELSDLGA